MAKGFSITTDAGINPHTNEDGTGVVYDVVLTGAPTAGRIVSLNFSSSNEAEGVVDNPNLVFDSSNWDVPQQFTVYGVNDYVWEDGTAYTIIGYVNPETTDTTYRQMGMGPFHHVNDDDLTTEDTTPDSPRIPAGASRDMPVKIYGDAIVDQNIFDPNTGQFEIIGTKPMNDVLQGLDGDDILYGKDLQDDLSGGEGYDALYGGDDEDFLYGEAGDDTLDGGQGVDYLYGGEGDDVLKGGVDDLASDTMNGGSGDDTYYMGYGVADVVVDNSGIDTVWTPFNLSSYTLVNGIEKGIIDNSSISSEVTTLNGNGSNNILTGNDGVNNLSGGAGSDTVNAGLGSDSLTGGLGNDKLNAGAGNDKVVAGSGNDNVAGAIGNDTLAGGIGNDTIVAGGGNDVINGDAGVDVLSGGAGVDTFMCNDSLVEGVAPDVITDYAPVYDTIKLETTIFTSLFAGVLDESNFVQGSEPADLDDYILYNPDTGELQYDADGAGAGVAVQIALIGNHAALTAADFVVI